MRNLFGRGMALILVLVVMAVPMAAMAEGGGQSIVVSHFSYDIEQLQSREKNARLVDKSGTIDATAEMTVGKLPSGEGYFHSSASTANAPIYGAAAILGDEIRLHVDGMTNSYVMSVDELAADLMADVTSSGADEGTGELMAELLASYIAMLRDMIDPDFEEMVNESLMAAVQGLELDAEVSDQFEVIAIMGRAVEAQRTKYVIKGDTLDAIYDGYFSATPALRRFWDGYFELIGRIDVIEGAKPTTVSQLYEAMGMPISFDVVQWTNALGHAARIEMVCRAGRPGLNELIIPITIDALTDGDVHYQMFTTTMPVSQNGRVDISVTSVDDRESVVIDMSATAMAGNKRVGEMTAQYIGRHTGEAPGETHIDGRLTMKGTIHLSGESWRAEFGADVAVAKGAGVLMQPNLVDDYPALRLRDMTDEQIGASLREVAKVGMTATGGLMQIPEMAKAMAWAAKMGMN